MIFSQLYNFAANAFTGPSQGVATAINIEAVDLSEEWLHLAPFGTTAYYDEKSGRKFEQVFEPGQAAEMVAAFNALKTAKGAKFRGLHIFEGHPDADPQRWNNEQRLGGVMDVEARADGIWIKPAWNDRGRKNLEEGYLIYPSVGWLYPVAEAMRSGRIVPNELRSVGMTNSPNIPDVTPWTNSKTNETQAHNMDRKQLAKLLGLDPETVTDEQITSAIEALIKKSADAKTEAENAAAADAEKKMAENAQPIIDARDKFRALAINAQLDKAIEDGRLTAAEKDGFQKKLEHDFDAGSKELEEKHTALNTKPIQIDRAHGSDLSSAAGRRLAFNAAIDPMIRPVTQGGKGYSIDAAIEQLRATPEGAALIKAMEAPAA